MHLGVSEADVLPVSPQSVSTPEQKCIGWPEQKYITKLVRRPPESGALGLGISSDRS